MNTKEIIKRLKELQSRCQKLQDEIKALEAGKESPKPVEGQIYRWTEKGYYNNVGRYFLYRDKGPLREVDEYGIDRFDVNNQWSPTINVNNVTDWLARDWIKPTDIEYQGKVVKECPHCGKNI